MSGPTHAERSRTLAENGKLATLSTLALDPAGFPFGSLVAYALDADGHPLLLLSDLAEHTHNLKADPRCSLMVAEQGVAEGRVTLLGEAQPAEGVRDTYLAKHPEAAQYVDFKDFRFYRLEVSAVRYVGGFGRMSWVTASAYGAAQADPLAPHRQGIIEHMNEDHEDSMLLIAEHLGGVKGEKAVMREVDRYGYELKVDGKPLRLSFSEIVEKPDQVRVELVRATRAAREALGVSK